jgi:DNA-binding IclR family transcriptional regulator
VIGFFEERILRALRTTPRGSSPAQLARDLTTSPEVLQTSLTRLRDAGYVAPRSPRVPWYALTPYGYALLACRAGDPDETLTL